VRIVLLSDRIPPENAGGAEKIVWSLARGLREARHDVSIVATTQGAAFEEVRDGIPTYHLHSNQPMRFQAYWGIYNPQTVAAFRHLLHRLKPDVAHAHLIHNGLSYWTLKVAHDMGCRVIFTAHDAMTVAYGRLTHFVREDRCDVDSPDAYRLPFGYNLRQMRFRYNPFRNLAIRHILNHYTHERTCVSAALGQALASNRLEDFKVVHNGVDMASFAAPPDVINALRQRLSLGGRKVILFAGRLTADKGSYQLLRAMLRLVERLPNVTLLMLSRASLQQQRLDTIEFRPLVDKHIVVGGWLTGDDLAAAYQLADVVAVPSIYLDPLPTINLEGMAAGKPVVATCFGGSPEVVVDGETGYVVNPFDTKGMADRLYRLLTDTTWARQMGERGRARVEQQFRLEHMVARMERIYANTLR
jgi:glycosyltransferase involved in cell wall biosynthesis